jgi:type I restriction enzyme R subunit
VKSESGAEAGNGKPDEDRGHLLRGRVEEAGHLDPVVDIFSAAGLKKPDISILSDEFLAEVRGMPQKNLAVELLQKLLRGEVADRRRKNVVQARSFAEMLEQTLRKLSTTSL